MGEKSFVNVVDTILSLVVLQNMLERLSLASIFSLDYFLLVRPTTYKEMTSNIQERKFLLGENG